MQPRLELISNLSRSYLEHTLTGLPWICPAGRGGILHLPGT